LVVGLRKGVTYVRTKNQKILSSSKGIKKARAGLVNTVCKDFVEHFDGPGAAQPVTDAPGFLLAIKGLDIIGPHKVEHGVILFDGGWVTKAALVRVLVQLEIFGVLPIHPVVLLDEATTHKAHNPCRVILYIAGEDNIVALSAEYARAVGVLFSE
jgi:hypothetical protein